MLDHSILKKLWRAGGFTLVEIAIVLLLIGLIAGNTLGPLNRQIEQKKINDTQKLMEENRDALLGFATRHGYLPCPALSATDGNEGPRNTNNECINLRGFLPWVALGTTKSDSWGRLLRYAVTSRFTNSTIKVPFSQLGSFSIVSSYSPLVSLAAAAPLIILSHGANGYGATQENGVVLTNSSTSNGDEQRNFGPGNIFVNRVHTEKKTAPGGEFDDIVTWIPTSILFNRMVAAGQLP
jgi:type II secretory pathway pseudopilin PulG